MTVSVPDTNPNALPQSTRLSADPHRRWDVLWRWRRPGRDVDPDANFKIWKAAWVEGAKARWAGVSSGARLRALPFASAAWEAGWHWAEQNPDRRKGSVLRLAHRRRRATDSTSLFPRVMQMGALGLALYGLSRSLQKWAGAGRPER